MSDQHRETGIRLPKALRDELNIDDTRAPKNKKKGTGGGWPQDRKAQRKQDRDDKKSQKDKNKRQATRHAPPPARGARVQEVEVDPFDISDPSDIEELMAQKPKKKEAKKEVKKEAKKEAKKDKKTEEKKPKPILKPSKTSKRKADDDSDADSAPAKKKSALSKGILDKMAQDDAEIALLEKRLKMKGKKIPKAFEDDGLDFLLEGLDQDYLDDRKEKAAKKNKADKKAAKKYEESEDSEDDEDDGLDDLMDGLGDDSELDGSDEGSDEGSDDGEEGSGSDDGEFGGFSDDDAEEKPEAPAPRVRENPYKPGVTITEDTTAPEASVAKYIPPSLRKAASTDSERIIRLRRQVQGLINRLSEVKLISILGDVEEIYRENPRADVTGVLTDILVSTLCDPSVLMDTYHILHGGFLAGLYKILGTDVGATVVQRIVEEFIKNHDKVNGIADPSTAGKECTNLISFLSELYNFGVVGCVLIFDFIRMFLSELTELHTELLLKIVRNAGPQLRTDDPTALKSLILLLQPAILKAGGHGKLSVRTKFMIETLTNLKNNRLKSATANSAVTTEHTIRMKKLLGTLNTRQLRATEPLRASLDDIRNTETKGKWWLVGASWSGAGAVNKPAPVDDRPAAKAAAAYISDDEDSAMPDLQALARQHRMNTDIRRAIFITLLSSSDYSDAHGKLLKLGLKRSQEREIPRVLLHCAAGESNYNPYYTLVAKKLCGGHALKMTFTFTLWDYFRRFGEDDGSGASSRNNDNSDSEDSDDEGLGIDHSWKKASGLRKIVNLARVYAALVASDSLGITVFKTLNWSYLQPATKSFLEVFFTALFTETKGDQWEAASIFGKFADNIELVRGVHYFVRKRVLKTGGVAASDAERKMVKSGARAAVETLEAVLKADTVGSI